MAVRGNPHHTFRAYGYAPVCEPAGPPARTLPPEDGKADQTIHPRTTPAGWYPFGGYPRQAVFLIRS